MLGKTGFLRRDWIAPAVAFAGVLMVFFFPVAFQGKVLAPLDILDHLMRPWSDGAGGFGVHNAMVCDAISQYLPYDWAVFQSLQQDGFIGWNPHVYGGYALLENTMLCPGDWHHQLYRLFDFWTAWDLGILFQFAIAGFGMIALLGKEGVRGPAALVGAVSFAFYSQHMTWVYHRWVLGTSCWFPWIVMAFRDRRRRGVALSMTAPVFLALALRGGHLQACLFVALLTALLFFDEWVDRQDRFSLRGSLRASMPFAVAAAIAAILFLDIAISTIPAWRAGCKELDAVGTFRALSALPTLAGVIFPNLFGSPETMDAAKAFGSDALDMKFAGAVPFLLAFATLFRKDAPRAAKLLFVAGLVIPFTPLRTWFYSRCTVLFGLGCSWLAAWNLDTVRDRKTELPMRLAVIGLLLLAISWALAGTAMIAFSSKVTTILHETVKASVPADRTFRLPWLLARTDAFVSGFPPWSRDHAPAVLAVFAGLFAAWKATRFSIGERSRTGWLWATAFLVAVDMAFFARSWLVFSPRPLPETRLYDDRTWTSDLLRELDGAGYLYVITGGDFDFFQVNTQSGLGIHCLQGYETITPSHPPIPPESELADLERAARVGISHVIVPSPTQRPAALSEWTVVMEAPDFTLFRNPSFKSRCLAFAPETNTEIAVKIREASPNHLVLAMPPGVKSAVIAQSFHPGWSAAFTNSGQSVSVRESDEGGLVCEFDGITTAPTHLDVCFRPSPSSIKILQFAVLVLLFASCGAPFLKCNRPGAPTAADRIVSK